MTAEYRFLHCCRGSHVLVSKFWCSDSACGSLNVAGRTMKKKGPPILQRILIWFFWKIVIMICVGVCMIAILRFHSEYDFSSPASFFRVRSRSPDIFEGPPKIAFLFLVRQSLPLDFLWNRFFENANPSNYSIFIHSTPGFEFNESTTKSIFLYGRQLKNSIQVAWGESSMIEAERLLLAAALADPGNQRFVLLSDSCVPLYNFSYIYNYVMASPMSFVDSFLDTKEGRYNKKMSRVIPKRKWRKGSQWITLIRDHVHVVVGDKTVFSVFKKHCQRRAPVVPISMVKHEDVQLKNKGQQEQHNCIPDEHYVQTLLSMRGLENEVQRRTLTYTSWNNSAAKMEDNRWHPITFTYASAGRKSIKKIKEINHVYYDTEFRTEWCRGRANKHTVPCFLFARKFSPEAAMRLLE